MLEGACNVVSLKVEWVARSEGGAFLANHPITYATCTGIEDFLYVRMFSQINWYSLIIFKMFHIYKKKNLVHFFNPTSFGLL